MSRSRFRSSLVVAGSLLALTACGGDDDDGGDSGGSTPTSASSPASSPSFPPAPTTEPSPTDAPGSDGPGVPAGYPPRPQPDQCVLVPEASDGNYTVYEAGTAVVTREGDRLVLGAITPAEGWTSRVDDQEDDEIEIDFRMGGNDVLDLEVEIDDGRLEVKICADDD